MAMTKSKIAEEFQRLAERLTEFWRRSKKPLQLAIDLQESEVRAGRLLVAAIDAAAFPKKRASDNAGWWDRTARRVPGGPLTLFGGQMAFRAGKLSPGDKSAARANADGSWTDQQFRICWRFAVGTWLVRSFPERFREGAADWDWSRVATDSKGRILNKQRKPHRQRWYRDGKPLPRNFNPYSLFDPKSDLPPGNYTSKPEGEIAQITDFYDNEDRLEHLRRRAEVHSDACRLLAELIAPSHAHTDAAILEAGRETGPDKGSASKVQNLSLSDESFLIARIRDETGFNPTSLLKYAKDSGVTTPGRGKKNFRYPKADVVRILKRIIDACTVAATRARCEAWLKILTEIK